ncbi:MULTISPECIES: nucleotide exchange factor GrpE [unclassified Synechocystis]|uniref:nucleotide exchange factor GrpE n=1 Tax=unclassified Synechocystis TaxID=2640012 RepID=UPI0004215AE1|nr:MULTISPECIES: nucleotide exchange factor GrpE [unclassified Synechocystis]AIE73213.1 Heat shock protein GrpE [Synechocystis sp. PCC 6714]MCT0254274.1 nucleotide exchange factor GrpE [Synechocystis sp. CS-94]
MNNQQNLLQITPDYRDKVLADLQSLLKEKRLLAQLLKEEEKSNRSASEALFLEFLELFDMLESLLLYLEENPEPNPRFIKRLPKSLGTIQSKLLTILERREVNLIEFGGDKPDFNFCQVVDTEVREDLEEKTITKVVRKGFKIGDSTLRPIEVITSKKLSQ